MPTQFDEYERHAHQLERIAGSLERNGEQYAALERAGWALGFVTMRYHREFQRFLEELERGELSPEAEAHLKKLGLD